MSDSYGDGWNGNELTLNGQSFTLESGSEGTESTCYDPELGCAEVVVSEGGWAYEVSWTITNESGDLLLSGGSPYVLGIWRRRLWPCTGVVQMKQH